MAWFIALCSLNHQNNAELLQEALERLSPAPEATTAIEIDEENTLWEVGAYFDQQPDVISLALLSEAYASTQFTVSEVADENWVERVNRELPPVRVGQFVVYGNHCQPVLKAGELPLLIEASLAFGTGHHATTQLCLEIIDAHYQEGFEVALAADIGCGTGLLALAMAALWNCHVDCGDTDPTAIDICRYNADKNGQRELINATIVDGAPVDRFEAGAYDLVAANILSDPLIRLAPQLTRLLLPSGRLILSGITHDQIATITTTYQQWGLMLIQEHHQAKWGGLVFSHQST